MRERYATVEHLASGGMGELDLARLTSETGVERLVVTKRLRADLLEDQRAMLMLVDEARIAATLYHRNIVPVLDIVVEDSAVMLVLEYFPSVNLAQLLDQIGHGLPYAVACSIAEAIAGGLHYAHERESTDGISLEIVHRDVSLPNILVGDHGHVKLTDFGVAKARSRYYVTRSASLKGKLGYMAPEQIRGEAIDRRVDVFALGVVLFEMATGVPLFTASSDFDTMRRIMDDRQAIASLRPELPGALVQVIERAIHADRHARYATAAELGEAIATLAASEGWSTAPSEIRAIVAANVPAGVAPWRRGPALAGATTDRTTNRWVQ